MFDVSALTETFCLIGTGPSLTMDQIATARAKGFTLYGCNLTFLDIPDLAVVHACNFQLWDVVAEKHLDAIMAHPARKTTTRPEAAAKYKWLEYYDEIDKPGLSATPGLLHHGHSSGYQLLGLAYHAGADRIILLGYDLRFPKDYNGAAQYAGGKRHYFGEYKDPRLHHWPKADTSVKHGEMVGLIPYYESVAKQGLVEILNATPDSALTCFPKVSIDAL